MFRRCYHIVLLAALASACCRLTHANTSCTKFQETIQLLPELTMSYVMNVHDHTTGQGTLTVEAVLQKVGWIGIGFSDSGFMAPSTAVIALPDEPVSNVNPAKYHITSSYDGGMRRDMEPSLSNANILQNETTTVLSFTIPLLRKGEVSILVNETNHIIFAFGYRNDLSYHADRDSISLQFTPCQADAEDHDAEDVVVETPTEEPVDDQEELQQDVPEVDNPNDKSEEANEPEHDIQSCLKFKNRLQLSPQLTMDYVVKQYDNKDDSDHPDGIMSAQITYEGLGWIGFGVTVASGAMIPGEVIIGLPDEPLGVNNPGKYVLNGRGQSAVELLPESSQTLINSTISQTDTTTILTFHKHLVEPGEMPINGNGLTTFIWAHGTGNELAGHVDRGAFNLTLHPCNGNLTTQSQETGNVVKVQTSGAYRSLWTAHGVFGGIAWGIIVPLAIASTLLRDLFGNQKLAVKIHIVLNSTASLFTLIAFLLAVVGRQKSTVAGESPNHFAVVAHRSVGLVIMIFTVFQVVAGLCRPVKQQSQIDTDEEEVWYKVPSKKSIARTVWEIVHKVIGFAMAGIAWLQVYSGLTLYVTYFPVKYDLKLGFCAAVVSIASLTFLSSLYSIWCVKRRTTVPITITTYQN